MAPAPGRLAVTGAGAGRGAIGTGLAEGAPAREGRLVGPAGLLVRLGEERPGVAVELVLRVVPEVVDDLGEPPVLELLLARSASARRGREAAAESPSPRRPSRRSRASGTRACRAARRSRATGRPRRPRGGSPGPPSRSRRSAWRRPPASGAVPGGGRRTRRWPPARTSRRPRGTSRTSRRRARPSRATRRPAAPAGRGRGGARGRRGGGGTRLTRGFYGAGLLPPEGEDDVGLVLLVDLDRLLPPSRTPGGAPRRAGSPRRPSS